MPGSRPEPRDVGLGPRPASPRHTAGARPRIPGEPGGGGKHSTCGDRHGRNSDQPPDRSHAFSGRRGRRRGPCPLAGEAIGLRMRTRDTGTPPAGSVRCSIGVKPADSMSVIGRHTPDVFCAFGHRRGTRVPHCHPVARSRRVRDAAPDSGRRRPRDRRLRFRSVTTSGRVRRRGDQNAPVGTPARRAR